MKRSREIRIWQFVRQSCRRLGWLLLPLAAAGLMACAAFDIEGALEDEPPIVKQATVDLIPIVEGSAEDGKDLLRTYGCSSCHTIPGVREATADVGPPLADWADRHYVAGSLVNTPENLIAWIAAPQAVEPGTAMPNTGVTADQVRDMAAYLFTLEEGH